MKKLAKNKYQLIFFSPHLDDAVLSCGGYMASLGEEKSILVATVFSSAREGEVSKYTKRYLKFCGFKDVKDYFNSRKKEEKKVAEILKYDASWLDFPEAIFRFKKKFFCNKFFYNDLKNLLGRVNGEDIEILDHIKVRIEKIISNYSNKSTRIYFPLAIGNHVDHQIINKIGINLARNDQNKRKIYFYEDFPYILKINKKRLENSLSQIGLKIKKIPLKDKYIRKKYEAILTYKSQIKPLFETRENFKKNFLKHHQKPYENYWQFA